MRTTLISFGLLFSLTLAAGASPLKTTRARIDAISADQATVVVTEEVSRPSPAEKWVSRILQVQDAHLKASLKESFHSGDLVWITVGQGKESATLRGIQIRKESTSFLYCLLTMVVVALALWIIACQAIQGTPYGMGRFLVGRDNRYSKSKFQAALWFATVIVVYLSTLYLRWRGSVPSLIGGVDIPQNLLLLTGISALSFAGAKGITQGKENRAAAAGLAAKPPANAPSFPSDLVSDDSGQPDLGDFQMVVITLIAVGVYLVQAFSFLSLLRLQAQISIPDVDPTLLGIFGISHGAYLTKKAVSGDEGRPVAQGTVAESQQQDAPAKQQPGVGQPGPV